MSGVSKLERPSSREARFSAVGMTCGHCVAAVTEAVSKLEGVTAVNVDLESGLLSVRSVEPIDAERIATAVDAAGYRVGP